MTSSDDEKKEQEECSWWAVRELARSVGHNCTPTLSFWALLVVRFPLTLVVVGGFRLLFIGLRRID